MELREIETFLVLADELHFGRTAERLYLSQSRVSQTIRAVERYVGGQLFERTSRRVRLTPLGELLRDRLGPAYQQVRAALDGVRETAVGITGELRISVLSFAAGGRDFERVVSTFASDHPGCRTVVYEAFPGEALNRLRRGELDLMAHWLPISQPELTIGPVLATEERALAVSVGHPLAERGWATVEDLADHAVIDAEGIMPAETVDVLYPRRTPGGRPIPRRQREGRTAEVLSLVARGEIVHPTVASLPLYYTHPGVTTIPLRGLPPVTAALIWVTDHETAAIRAFADTASSTVTSTMAGGPSPREHHVL